MPTNNRTDLTRQNLNFVQIDRRTMAAHRKLNMESPTAANILSLFTEHMDKSNAIVISSKAIQELIKCSRASVSSAIKKLKDDKWIQIVKIGNANAYVVNSAAFWTASRNSKYYSKFHATVIATESEQEIAVQKMAKVDLREVPTVHETERLLLGNDELPPPDQQDMDLD